MKTITHWVWNRFSKHVKYSSAHCAYCTLLYAFCFYIVVWLRCITLYNTHFKFYTSFHGFFKPTMNDNNPVRCKWNQYLDICRVTVEVTFRSIPITLAWLRPRTSSLFTYNNQNRLTHCDRNEHKNLNYNDNVVRIDGRSSLGSSLHGIYRNNWANSANTPTRTTFYFFNIFFNIFFLNESLRNQFYFDISVYLSSALLIMKF